jgi:hypothetical protein
MTISPAGTFDYVAVVPAGASRRWRAQPRQTPTDVHGRFEPRCLVGTAPWLEISDAGPTPDVRASEHTGTVLPRVLRSRITLEASTPEGALVRSVSFCLDRELTSVLHAGDELNVVRTPCGGTGVSIIRDRQLVAASGAVTAVPLGDSVQARIPWDVVSVAEAVFRRVDPRFEFRELPVELRVRDEVRLVYRGRPQIGAYEVFAEHGFYAGTPGTNECLAVCSNGNCPVTATIAAALLLDAQDGFEMNRW